MKRYPSTNDMYTPRILVVDDEQRIRDACRLVLEAEGFDVALAPDGDRGLKLIEAEHFDIILLDLMLPALSGFDVLSRVRSLHPDTVVIVITGYATVEHSIEAMKKGAFDVIPKPFTPEQLRVVVAKAIQYTRALQDIADARSRLRVMVNRLSDGVMTTDWQRRAVLANPAFLQMIGYQGQSVLGRTIDTFISDPSLCRMIDEALVMPQEEMAEISRELSFGPEQDRIISARCAPFRDRRGLNLGVITVLHDITELKRLDKIKSDFVSMVSHEIRSPMNSVLMQIRVIMDGLAGEVTDKQREILERAEGKIESLSTMASELLDLARIESGLISQEKELVQMASIIADQVAFHQAGAQRQLVTIELESLPDIPPMMANRCNMEEVLSNLISNAVKYSPHGGRIVVSAKPDNGYLIIRITDEGLGIPEEDLERIFSRFYRVKNEDTRYIHGTGLGLSIVKSIVEAHHGSIRAESLPERGSTFRVCLPIPEP